MFYGRELKIAEGTKSTKWSEYEKSSYLKEIVFPATLEEISGCTFVDCSNIETVTIPGTVKKVGYAAFRSCFSIKNIILCNGIKEIGENAFDCFGPFYFSRGNYSKFRVIALPESITKIGTNAFGEFSRESKPVFIVKRFSYAHEYVKENNFKFYISDFSDGFLSTENIHKATLYNWTNHTEVAKIDQGVKVIGSFAFSRHTEIKKVVLPDTIEEIQENAFQGCKSIKQVDFSNCYVKKIGEKAFFDSRLFYVDLPSSVSEIGPDAFSKKCVISIGGEMPGYAEAQKEILIEQRNINITKQELDRKIKEIATAEERLSDYENTEPKEFEDIPTLEETINALLKDKERKESDNREQIEALTRKLSQILSEVEQLKRARNHCSLFAISRRKELAEKISLEKQQESDVQAEIDRIKLEFSTWCEDLFIQMEGIDKQLQPIKAKQISWEIEHRNLRDELTILNTQKNKLSATIYRNEALLDEKRQNLLTEHEQWSDSLVRAKELEETSEFKDERSEILKSLVLPERENDPEFTIENASLDEVLLNSEYQRFLKNRSDIDYTLLFNRYIKKHTNEINRVQELNLILKKDEMDGLESFKMLEEPAISAPVLPERFVKFNGYFTDEETWKRLKDSIKDVSSRKNSKTNLCDGFFKGLDYLRLKGKAEQVLLVFPYCLVLYTPQEPMQIFLYNKVRISIKSRKQEIEDQDIPELGEFVSEHYLHENADGTPSKRYKSNPLITVIRYTRLIFSNGKNQIISVPVPTYDIADDISVKFKDYVSNLLAGNKKSVYDAITKSEELEAIDERMQAVILFEKEQRERAIQEAKAEEKRIKEQQIAEKLAAEQKRKDLIRKQKEINEERKRQAEIQKEREKEITKLFQDDFAEDLTKTVSDISETNDDNRAIQFPIEIVGNRVISNTVFKVEFHIHETMLEDLIVVYFVDDQGTIISNKKKIDASIGNDNIKLGFILNSGVNYSSMKRCFIQLESQNGLISRLDFKMNIAFSPDDF